MKILCVIPSRIGSTRLPRKPLVDLGGKPMIQRTYEAAKSCTDIDRVVVATDDQEIAQVIENVGGEVVMTAADIKTGSDRVAAVAKQFPDYDVVINLQGDEPFMPAETLSALVKPFLSGEKPRMTTVAHPLDFKSAHQNPNMVKVLCDQKGDALLFSRAAIPHFRAEHQDVPVYHHMGLYAFDKDFLQTFTSLTQTPIEKAELLEQMRALENGYKIRVCPVASGTIEINDPEDLAKAQKLFAP